MLKVKIDKKSLLEPIQKKAPSGIDIRYTNEFDALKELRKEEDRSVSYDIWARPLKAANWDELQERSIDILTHKSKNLQILVWLTESFPKTFEGIYDGISLIQQFVEKFFDSFYPQEPSVRVALLEWIQRIYTERVIMSPFGQDRLLTLDQWRYALFEKTPQTELLRKKLMMSDQAFLLQQQKMIQATLDSLNDLKKFLSSHLTDSPTFQDLFASLQEILAILTIKQENASEGASEDIQEPQEPQEPQEQNTLKAFSSHEIQQPLHESDQETKLTLKEQETLPVHSSPIQLSTDQHFKDTQDPQIPDAIDLEPEQNEKTVLLEQIESLSFKLASAGYKASADLVQYAGVLMNHSSKNPT